jgi:hypothetical protein
MGFWGIFQIKPLPKAPLEKCKLRPEEWMGIT